jgi:hypothetical protein
MCTTSNATRCLWKNWPLSCGCGCCIKT